MTSGTLAHRRRAAAAHTAGARPPPTPQARGRRPHRRRSAAAHTAGARSPLTPLARGRRPQHHTTGWRTESAREPNASTRAPLLQRGRPPSAHWRGSRGHKGEGRGAGKANRRGRRDWVGGGYRPRRGPQSESKSARKLERKPAVHRPPSRARLPHKDGRAKKARARRAAASATVALGGM